MLVEEKKRIYSVIELSLRKISYVLHVHAQGHPTLKHFVGVLNRSRKSYCRPRRRRRRRRLSSLLDHRRRQNVVTTKKWHTRR